ncbi:hypothetical protein Pcinc_002347 [Petrolisthes cinctipes]|uniref:Uncharacterized protein n=1 Tax=Petrolisthes cinctipes TaxID=88211 RepID=A0AAE1GL47_PETCI|nr:hypothetical protein Pcinc_002347 [Petrolisthes cinctipes]
MPVAVSPAPPPKLRFLPRLLRVLPLSLLLSHSPLLFCLPRDPTTGGFGGHSWEFSSGTEVVISGKTSTLSQPKAALQGNSFERSSDPFSFCGYQIDSGTTTPTLDLPSEWVVIKTNGLGPQEVILSGDASNISPSGAFMQGDSLNAITPAHLNEPQNPFFVSTAGRVNSGTNSPLLTFASDWVVNITTCLEPPVRLSQE